MNTFLLWEGKALGALGNAPEDTPSLTVYQNPDGGAQRAGIVICPGGAYAGLADHEGAPVAHWFESIGIRAFVLRYRLGPRYHHPVMLHDAERAIRYVRAQAQKFGVDPKRIGVLGFSAGGHLASTVSTHFSPGKAEDTDPIERVSSRPDFSILIYPVITMRDPHTHAYSREMLLGQHPSQKDIDDLSNERAISLDTPPTFIVHGANDDAVPIQNALGYANGLADHRVPFEMHIPGNGPHGFGLGYPNSPQDWRALCAKWLESKHLLP